MLGSVPLEGQSQILAPLQAFCFLSCAAAGLTPLWTYPFSRGLASLTLPCPSCNIPFSLPSASRQTFYKQMEPTVPRCNALPSGFPPQTSDSPPASQGCRSLCEPRLSPWLAVHQAQWPPACPKSTPRAFPQDLSLLPSCLERSAPRPSPGHSVTSLLLQSPEGSCSHPVLVLAVSIPSVPLELQLHLILVPRPSPGMCSFSGALCSGPPRQPCSVQVDASVSVVGRCSVPLASCLFFSNKLEAIKLSSVRAVCDAVRKSQHFLASFSPLSQAFGL